MKFNSEHSKRRLVPGVQRVKRKRINDEEKKTQGKNSSPQSPLVISPGERVKSHEGKTNHLNSALKLSERLEQGKADVNSAETTKWLIKLILITNSSGDLS